MRRNLWIPVLLIAVLPFRLHAQRPGELAGRVAEARTGAPVEMAAVEIPELGVRAWSDAAGRFRIRALEPGRYAVRVTRTGYGAGAATVEVRNGEETWIAIPLAAVAVALEAVTVQGARDPLAEGTQVARAEIVRSGARRRRTWWSACPAPSSASPGPRGRGR